MTVRIVILAMVAAACAQSQVRAVNPINNSAATPHQVFTFQAASSDGSAVSEVYMRFGWQPWYGADQCSMAYIPSAGTFYLMNDSGTTWTGGLPVGSGTIQNGQCTLNLANTSVSGAMNNLTINADLTFDPTLKGSVGVYFAMTDGAAGDAGWYPLGSWLAWNLVSTAAPSVSFLASTTSGGATTFTYDFSDVNGYKYIYNNYALINPSLVANNSCEFSMFPGSNQIYLLSDSGGAWSSPETLGDSSQGALANSQCSLNVAQSSTTRSGNLVEVHLVVTLMSTAAEMNYAAPFDEVFSTPGWQAEPVPSITSISPTSGPAGTVVTISGSNLQPTPTVTIGGMTANMGSSSSTTVTAMVPTGASMGMANVVVTVNGVSVTAPQQFQITPAASISVSPQQGPMGTPVTISGTGFGIIGQVMLGAQLVVTDSWNDGRITFKVPDLPVAAGSTLALTVTAGGATFSSQFVLTPGISSLSRTSGPAYMGITITGTKFGSAMGTSTLTLNGMTMPVDAANWSDSTISAQIPCVQTGNVVVTVGGSSSPGVMFTVNAGLGSCGPCH